jgi:hypothetical protein
MKNSNDTIENRTRDLPTYSAVPQISHTKNTKLLYKDHLVKCDAFLLDGYLHFRKKLLHLSSRRNCGLGSSIA